MPVAETPEPAFSPQVLPRENGRVKSTINLKTFTSPRLEEKAIPEVIVAEPSSDKPLKDHDLSIAWLEFAELRKNQIAEYNLLKKEYVLTGNLITIQLANRIEEPLLQNIKVQLIAHLRGKLNNNSINVTAILMETESKKIAYTAKEKFDQLAEKNPFLKELKDRFGLDPDF